jgi:hypothetical protein
MVPRWWGPASFSGGIFFTRSRNTKDKTRGIQIFQHIYLISPCRFRVKEGDHLIIGQCRPLSKTVRFNVLKVIPAGSFAGWEEGLHRNVRLNFYFYFSCLCWCYSHNGFRVICIYYVRVHWDCFWYGIIPFLIK